MAEHRVRRYTSDSNPLVGIDLSDDGHIISIKRFCQSANRDHSHFSSQVSSSGEIIATVVKRNEEFTLRLLINGVPSVADYVLSPSMYCTGVSEQCVSNGGVTFLMQEVDDEYSFHVFDAHVSRQATFSLSAITPADMAYDEDCIRSVAIEGIRDELHYFGIIAHDCINDHDVVYLLRISTAFEFSVVKLGASDRLVLTDPPNRVLHKQVIVVAGHKPVCIVAGPTSDESSAIICFDCETGQEEWRKSRQLHQQQYYFMRSMPNDRFAVACGCDVTVHGTDGMPRWKISNLLHYEWNMYFFSRSEQYVAELQLIDPHGFEAYHPVGLYRPRLLVLILAARRRQRRDNKFRLPTELYQLLWSEFLH
jgi:hypothetical protein